MEDSSSNQQPRCPCGFWGSAETLGLCSKCYREACSQSQENIDTSDVKPVVTGPNHNQSLSSFRGRMDSKHFPSRSTTDNLPSTLSQPGERPSLSAAPPATVDTSTAAATTVSSAMPAHMSSNPTTASGDKSAADTTVKEGPSSSGPSLLSRLPPASSDTDTSSSVSSDRSYDMKYDPGLCPSDSCSSLGSAASSLSVAFSSDPSSSALINEERLSMDTPTSIATSPLSSGLSPTAVDSLVSAPSISSSNKAASTSVDNIDKSVAKNNPAVISAQDCNKQIERTGSAALSEGSQNVGTSKQSTLGASASINKEQALPCKDDAPTSPQTSSARGVKRTREEMEAPSEESTSIGFSPQKNKKRCFTCNCRLELAQRTIGRCRCDRIFCALHRLPELHMCDFNHKEDGRREAREKMIKPTRHLGTSFRREEHS